MIRVKVESFKYASEAPEGVEVMTAIIDSSGVRNVQSLVKSGNFWWLPDMSMYVYYTPTHFAYFTSQEKEND